MFTVKCTKFNIGRTGYKADYGKEICDKNYKIILIKQVNCRMAKIAM